MGCFREMSASVEFYSFLIKESIAKKATTRQQGKHFGRGLSFLLENEGDGASQQVWPDLGNEARKEKGSEREVSE